MEGKKMRPLQEDAPQGEEPRARTAHTRRSFFRQAVGAAVGVRAIVPKLLEDIFPLEAAPVEAMSLGGVEAGWSPGTSPMHIIAGGDMLGPRQYEGQTFAYENGVQVFVPSLTTVIPPESYDIFQGLLFEGQPGSVIVPTPDGNAFYMFEDEGRKVRFVGGEQKQLVVYKTRNPNYKPTVRWSEGLGIVGTDGLRITHQYAKETNSWHELSEYIALGTPKQRMEKRLKDLLSAKTTNYDGSTVENPLGLNPIEVAQYLRDWSDNGIESFKVLNNAKGEPMILIATGGKYGLNKQLGNIEGLQVAAARLNEVDPNALDYISVQLGVNAIAGDIVPSIFDQEEWKSYGASPFSRLGVIKYNEIGTRPYYNHLARLFVEGRGIKDERRLEWDYARNSWVLTVADRLHDDVTYDKALWFIRRWLAPNQYRLSSDEVSNLLNFGNLQLPDALKVLLTNL